jgi:hypothetical protein
MVRQSPVKYFTGHVVLHDPLTLPMVAAFERALADSRALSDPTRAELQAALLPGLLPSVAEWHLAHLSPAQLSPETWPGAPREAAAQLIEWLTGIVLDAYNGEVDVPND